MIYQISAIIILLCFYGVYIGKMLLQRKHNIQTNQMAKGNKPRKLFLIELFISISSYAIVIVEFICICCNWSMSPMWLRIAGLVLSSLGVVIFAFAVVTMRDSWRAGIPEKDKTELVSNGIYRFSRNPAFLGFDLLYLGTLLCFFNFLLLPFTLWVMIIFHLQILQEEEFLLKTFGEDYRAYKSKVLRYLGRKISKEK